MYKFSLILLLIFSIYQNSSGAPGDLDLSFGNNGRVITDFDAQLDEASYVLTQPDGKIIVIGYANSVTTFSFDFGLVRYNSNGTIDQSFGTDGKVKTDLESGNTDFALSGILQSDGKIVVIGSTSTGAFAVVRYNSNGSLDMTFDGDGKVIIPFGLTTLGWTSALQPDGKIIAAGYIRNGGNYDFALTRLNSNGSLDTTFGNGGTTITSFSNLRDELRSIALQPDGKIVAAGFASNGTDSDFAIARYNSNGSLDTTFDGDGKLITQIGNGNDFAYSMFIQPDGKYVLAGESFTGMNSDTAIVRYLPDGSLDSSFNMNGKIIIPVTSGNDGAFSAVLQPNGKIVTGGFAIATGNRDFALTRINTNGTLDLSFNGSGKVLTDFNSFEDGGTNVKIQTDGKIVICGYSYDPNDGNSSNYAVARFIGDAIVENSKTPFDFDGDTKSDISIFRPAPGEWWINRSSDGGNFATQFGASTDKIVPADYTGDGKTDVAFWRPSSGQWFILRSEDSSFFAFPFGASGDVPVPADYDGDGKADAAVFRESSLTWFIQKSSGGTDIIGFGAAGDKPVVADYDGDGKADIAIYRPNGANGAEWWIRRSSDTSVFATQFGTASDKPVQGDFTGDGKADVAFFRPSNGNWFILRSEDFSFFAFPFGTNGDVPVAGDYDGDGKFDAGVFRPTNQNWYVQLSTAGTLIQQFGIAGDLPTPNAFVP